MSKKLSTSRIEGPALGLNYGLWGGLTWFPLGRSGGLVVEGKEPLGTVAVDTKVALGELSGPFPQRVFGHVLAFIVRV